MQVTSFDLGFWVCMLLSAMYHIARLFGMNKAMWSELFWWFMSFLFLGIGVVTRYAS